MVTERCNDVGSTSVVALPQAQARVRNGGEQLAPIRVASSVCIRYDSIFGSYNGSEAEA